jgi:hypothetical protein
MSLKAFHVIFISASSALALGCGIWGLKQYFSQRGQALDLVFGLGGLVATAALIVYGRYFLKKLKNVGYL